MITGTLPPVSNKASWNERIEFYDDETGDLLSLSEAYEIEATIRNQQCETEVIKLTKSSGRIVVSEDSLSAEFTVTRSEMASLQPKTYEVGIRIIYSDDTDEQQIFLGYLPVLNGL